MSTRIDAARDRLRAAKSVAVLKGAGVSAESGIPTFRSDGGYWKQHRFEDLATPEAFAGDPKFVWTCYEERLRSIALTEPNAGHRTLVEMERRVADFAQITQNVDGLHDRAVLNELPPLCGYGGKCGGMMRTGVVWFGESPPAGAMERTAEAVRASEVLIVAGTSAQVYPAAELIPLALSAGVVVVEVNPAETEFSDEVTFALRGPAAQILPALL